MNYFLFPRFQDSNNYFFYNRFIKLIFRLSLWFRNDILLGSSAMCNVMSFFISKESEQIMPKKTQKIIYNHVY
jgi:hypothetical protein